ncbi:HigA family addiction module antitoxin [Chthonobacter albigriseus]|uniref:HigA family addiction module antitoxin n=1 Tax=Chthonobacter albigriseus TaxID=1683161 RepID=UPI0015EE89E0|nr:HigA family addiction module antitoxin [Chthonobacter albigriseus]
MSGQLIRPGKILAEELAEVQVTPTECARQINVRANRISQIVNGKRAITDDRGLRLGRWFGTSALFWLYFQSSSELRLVAAELGDRHLSLPARKDATSPAKVAAPSATE